MTNKTTSPVPGKGNKALTLDTINPAIIEAQYAVRGELATKADKYMQAIEAGGEEAAKLPFDKVVTANIGNPQQAGLGQKPITFWRQVISLLEYPELMENPLAQQIYPADTIERAKKLYSEIGSVGAYTHSKGVRQIRERVAQFLESELSPFPFIFLENQRTQEKNPRPNQKKKSRL